jgi:hypothetical protein
MADSTVDNAWAFIRANTTGEIRFDEHVRPIRYVVEPGGRLVAPAMVAMLTALETVLFVPDCAEGSMELLLTVIAFEEEGEDGAFADRWRIYHGEPEDVRWAFLEIDAAKYQGEVIDGEALSRPNPLADVEAALCRQVNTGARDALRRLCAAHAAAVEEPVMVGIDPLGIDVRRRFDVVRVPAPEPMTTADEARRVLDSMLREESSR